ncbi:tetratricopeptide repeat protein [Flavobacterium sp.]|uniref:tetratricopeptide repeat protein n=1 Tax=Flavobacterium sp. TaxID=239 RepID=UPI0037BE279F
MNVTEFTYLLNHPNAINEKQAKSLETVLDNFPYFQSARALHLKGLYNQDSYKYNFALKTTAAHTTDRSVLFDFITSDEFTIIEKDVYQKKLAQLLNIDVNESEYVTQLPNDIEKTDYKEPEIIADEVVEFVYENGSFEDAIIDSTKEAIDFVPAIAINKEVVNLEPIASEHKFEIATISEVEEPVIDTEEQLSDSKELEANLEIGKPITFLQNEKHSFQEWLQLASFKPIEREVVVEEVKKEAIAVKNESPIEDKVVKKTKKTELIDKFIENNPKITPARDLVDIQLKPIEIPDTTHLMTETLARVYLEQKKYQKAIQAYEILILKYPEKSIFFADRIQNIKILQQNNQ